jgi:hypothetical protein
VENHKLLTQINYDLFKYSYAFILLLLLYDYMSFIVISYFYRRCRQKRSLQFIHLDKPLLSSHNESKSGIIKSTTYIFFASLSCNHPNS